MDKLLSLAAGVFYLGIVPSGAGWFLSRRDRKAGHLCRSWVYGILVMMAVYQLVSVPLILLHRSLTESIIGWHIGLVLWILVFAVLRKKRLPEPLLNQAGRYEGWSYSEHLLLLVLAVLVIMQCAYYVFGMHIDDDDARYVANAVAAAETNTMYRFHPNTGEAMKYFMGEIGKEVTSPLMMFYAALAVLTGIHPAILIHTFLPPVLLIAGYGILWLLAEEIWPEGRTQRLLFLAAAVVFRMMGNTSIYTGSTFSLMRIWQGKALVAALFVPFVILIYLRIYLRRPNPYAYVLLCTMNLAACLSSGMGIYLCAILTGTAAAALLIRTRSLRAAVPVLLCCIPNAVYTWIYLLVYKVILR